MIGELPTTKIALIGLPKSGKTTLWAALTGQFSGVNNGISPGRQPRSGFIRWSVGPLAHEVPEDCRIELLDTPPLYRGAVEEQVEWADVLAECDALVQVLRLFTRGWLEAEGSLALPNPIEEIDIVDGELLMRDLFRLRGRLDELDARERLSRKEEGQREALIALLPALEHGQFVRDMGLDAGESANLTGLRFVTALPMIYAANADEEVFLGEVGEPVPEGLAERLEARGAPLLPVCARLEADAAALVPEEGEEFLYQQGVRESAAQRLLRELDHLGIMTRRIPH